jgi:hypothetical protein
MTDEACYWVSFHNYSFYLKFSFGLMDHGLFYLQVDCTICSSVIGMKSSFKRSHIYSNRLVLTSKNDLGGLRPKDQC